MSDPQLVVTRSHTDDQDLLYVDTATGATVGWVDLRTGRRELAMPERSSEFDRAVHQWRDACTAPVLGRPTRRANGVHPRPPVEPVPGAQNGVHPDPDEDRGGTTEPRAPAPPQRW